MRPQLAGVACSLTLLLAACGGGEDGTAAVVPAESTSVTAPPAASLVKPKAKPTGIPTAAVKPKVEAPLESKAEAPKPKAEPPKPKPVAKPVEEPGPDPVIESTTTKDLSYRLSYSDQSGYDGKGRGVVGQRSFRSYRLVDAVESTVVGAMDYECTITKVTNDYVSESRCEMLISVDGQGTLSLKGLGPNSAPTSSFSMTVTESTGAFEMYKGSLTISRTNWRDQTVVGQLTKAVAKAPAARAGARAWKVATPWAVPSKIRRSSQGHY